MRTEVSEKANRSRLRRQKKQKENEIKLRASVDAKVKIYSAEEIAAYVRARTYGTAG